MTMLRNRLVIEQDGEEHVSGELLAPDEIADRLDLEAMIHRAGGWRIERKGSMLRCQKQTTVRWIWVRSREPMRDWL